MTMLHIYTQDKPHNTGAHTTSLNTEIHSSTDDILTSCNNIFQDIISILSSFKMPPGALIKQAFKNCVLKTEKLNKVRLNLIRTELENY